jgi:AcrR family transcriptional regulator
MNVHSSLCSMTDRDPTTRSDKAERILDAALVLFAERGFHGTAVPLVAERAQVGAGTIYRYFASKEALVNALYQRWKEALLRAVLVGFPFEKAPREQLVHFVRATMRFARENPDAFRFLELHHHAPYLDEKSKAIEERALGMVRTLLSETSRLGLTKPVDPGLLSAIVWGGIVGLVRESEQGHVRLDDDALPIVEQILWEAIRV